MKTKAEIVQRLLNEGKIDAEEAVILLTGEPATYIGFVQPSPYHPIYPLVPATPIWQVFPDYQPTYCTN